VNRTIDLNADLGEGQPHDAALMRLVTSANVSCAAHAGDATTIRKALLLARKYGVSVGAHVGYFDVPNFGRVERPVTAASCHDAFAACVYQIGALIAFAKHFDVRVNYVKPHGALYNQANREVKLGRAVAAACRHFGLPLVCLADSPLHNKLRTEVDLVAEGFADRQYGVDGSLVPRGSPGAVLHDVPTIVHQVIHLIDHRGVDTICVHGDTPDAVGLLKAIRQALKKSGVTISA
jgi:5-oxoprolinase (ATP-hydrolysing) subunit A